LEKRGAVKRQEILEAGGDQERRGVVRRQKVLTPDAAGLVGRETAISQFQQSVHAAFYALATEVVRQGVLEYARWKRCGYIRDDYEINELKYWDDWKAKRVLWSEKTMMISAARAQLEAIKTDAKFMQNGIAVYMEVLGYEKKIEWLQKEVATHLGRESDTVGEGGGA
jgi:hypothetical protein